jgi:acetylcholinesterase
MSKSWASFVADLDPNGWSGREAGVPDWPNYQHGPKNLVFDANVTSFIEVDDFRAAGIKIINDNQALYHR